LLNIYFNFLLILLDRLGEGEEILEIVQFSKKEMETARENFLFPL
jgi:hypothetical protein